MIEAFSGAARRLFRTVRRWEAGRERTPRSPGRTLMWGYGMQVEYPDRLIWLHQFLDIFSTDFYNVRSLPEDARVIDGGANIGMFTLYVLWRKPNAHIVAVEPDSGNIEYLRRNISGKKDASVSIVHAALGAENGRTTLLGGESDAFRTTESEKGDVEVLPLRQFLDKPVHLLKLDIEGDELKVLEAAGNALENVERAVIEHHDYRGRPSTLPRMLAVLQKAGFERYRIGHNIEFGRPDPLLPSHCCLVEAWRPSSLSGFARHGC